MSTLIIKKVKDLRPGDTVDNYGVVEWVELPDGPNAQVDFVGHNQYTPLAKNITVRVRRG